MVGMAADGSGAYNGFEGYEIFRACSGLVGERW
jgi:hypothetical protein